MAMVDVFIWLFVILLLVGMMWLIRVIVRWTPPSARPAPVRLPPPVRQPEPVRQAPPPAAAPGYLPKWDGTRRWAAREDKAAWDGAFEALAGPPVPLPKPAPAPTPDEAAVFARLRDRLDHL